MYNKKQGIAMWLFAFYCVVAAKIMIYKNTSISIVFCTGIFSAMLALVVIDRINLAKTYDRIVNYRDKQGKGEITISDLNRIFKRKINAI